MRVRGALKVLGLVLGIGLVFAMAIPPTLYNWGSSLAGTMPVPPAVVEHRKQVWAWRAVERSEAIVVQRLTPYTPWLFLLDCAVIRPDPNCQYRYPGSMAAFAVAGRHLAGGARLTTMKRQIATASVAVWLTRHWSSAQLASRVFQIEEAAVYRADREFSGPAA